MCKMASTSQPNASNETPQVQSSFPLPPTSLVSKYTDEAVSRGNVPKPPAPISDSYMMFGLPCHQDDLIIRPLESQGLQRLHPLIYDRRKELKKLTVSILCNFLDLLDILVRATGSQARDEKIEDLNLLFIHIHHLINEFRPHQARETLKVMMEMQQAQMLDVGERLWKHIEKAGKILANCSTQLSAMQKEPMNIESLISSTTDMDNDIILGIQQTDIEMEVDEADMVKDIIEKDKILAGLIDEIEE